MGRFADAETGSKLVKENMQKTLGKDIINLKSRGNIKNTNVTTFDLFTNKVNVHFYMLSPLMMNRVARLIHITNVVTIHITNPRM